MGSRLVTENPTHSLQEAEGDGTIANGMHRSVPIACEARLSEPVACEARLSEASAHEGFMGLALAEAKAASAIGEVPVGAVVTKGDRVIAKAHNLRETTRDASAHAEFLAMREAMETLDAWRLEGCTVYVTLEPCIMCAGLMHQARIESCVFGAFDPKAGALGSLYRINGDDRLNHRFEAVGGIREAECAMLLKEFFRSRRKSRNKGHQAH